MCLFHVLLDLAKDWELTIHPVHVNHKFRPGAAEADQAFVEQASKAAGLTCRTFIYDCKQIAIDEKITAEEAGRNARYEAFAKVAAELRTAGVNPESIRIAVAQNADDQAETILFRILRGVGTDGLSGIRYKRRDEQGSVIIRPLLNASKEEILAYCTEQDIAYCVDETNMQPLYTRNKIRLELIPYLEKEFNTNIKETLVRLGRISAIDKAYLWDQAHDQFMDAIQEKTEHAIRLNGAKMRAMDRALRQRVISLALEDVGLKADVSYVHFEGCEDIIFHQKPSARFDLPDGYYITKVYDDVKVTRQEQPCEQNRQLSIQVLSKEEFQACQRRPQSYLALDAAKLETDLGTGAVEQISLRTRRPGDYIAIGAGSRKKLQDFFVDEKIPKDQREKMKLITIGSEILWVVPESYKGRYTANYKVENTTKTVICIEIFGSI